MFVLCCLEWKAGGVYREEHQLLFFFGDGQPVGVPLKCPNTVNTTYPETNILFGPNLQPSPLFFVHLFTVSHSLVKAESKLTEKEAVYAKIVSVLV